MAHLLESFWNENFSIWPWIEFSTDLYKISPHSIYLVRDHLRPNSYLTLKKNLIPIYLLSRKLHFRESVSKTINRVLYTLSKNVTSLRDVLAQLPMPSTLSKRHRKTPNSQLINGHSMPLLRCATESVENTQTQLFMRFRISHFLSCLQMMAKRLNYSH